MERVTQVKNKGSPGFMIIGKKHLPAGMVYSV